MAKLNWTNQAVSDLNKIAEYIGQESRKYASLTIKKIRLKAKEVLQNPRSGRIVPEVMSDDIREKIVGNYRPIYKITNEDAISVLTVFHTARLLITEKDDIHSITR